MPKNPMDQRPLVYFTHNYSLDEVEPSSVRRLYVDEFEDHKHFEAFQAFAFGHDLRRQIDWLKERRIPFSVTHTFSRL